MTVLLKAQSPELGAFFGDQREYGTGVPGVCQLLAWAFKLASEKIPEGILLWADISNGFNAMNRSAIEAGLKTLPPQLQWMRRSFHSFYANDLRLYFRRGAEVHTILGRTGTMQGDPASGVWFNVGLQWVYNKLRAEYPEVLMAKYFDDLNGFIPPAEGGSARSCLLTEERTQLVPGAYTNPDGTEPVLVPMARALTNRWKLLVKTHCGLEVKSKWGVTSVAVELSQADYGDPAGNGIPVTAGLEIAGTPVGTPDFVRGSVASIVETKVALPYAAISALVRVQTQHLLARNCGGTSRIQHIWQSVAPILSAEAIEATDNLTASALHVIAGAPPGTLPTVVLNQLFLPLRFGGGGYRRSKDVYRAAEVGAFAMSAYGG